MAGEERERQTDRKTDRKRKQTEPLNSLPVDLCVGKAPGNLLLIIIVPKYKHLLYSSGIHV